MAPKYRRREETPDVTEGSEIVTIQIPSGKKFHVHAHILVHHSKYFRAALNSPMKEAATLHFNLVEYATEEALDFFVTWIYSRSLPTHHVDVLQSCLDKRFPVYEHARQETVIKAWRLGDYLQATEFKNDALRLLHGQVACGTSYEHPFLVSQSALEGLDTDSPPYRMLAAILCRQVYGDSVDCIKEILEGLRDNEEAAVMKYMALFGAKIANELLSKSKSVATIKSNIEDHGHRLRLEDFLEKTE